jgi:hypothetical protein
MPGYGAGARRALRTERGQKFKLGIQPESKLTQDIEPLKGIGRLS